jgi:hypothetical protein
MFPTPIDPFLLDLDAQWPTGGPKIPLKVIGSTALMLQTDHVRGTKDSDVLGVDPVQGQVAEDLIALAGEHTRFHRKHQVYLDVVNSGLPFLPHPLVWHPVDRLDALLRNFEILVLDVTDVVVSKLKRFHENDKNDIQAMIDRELIDHAHLVDRFHSAAEVFSGDARASQVLLYAQNLNWVEREYLAVPETRYELPPWADA